MWVFSDDDAREAVLASFSSETNLSVPSINEWLDQWESDHRAKGGALAVRWEDKTSRGVEGRRRFGQRLLVELAYREAKAKGNSVPAWASDREGTSLQVNATQAQIETWFGPGGRAAFQAKFDALWREREGGGYLNGISSNAPALSNHPSKTLDLVRSKLKWNGRQRAFNKQRMAGDYLAEIVEAIQNDPREELPLAALFLQQNDQEVVFSWGLAQTTLDHYGQSSSRLVEAINRELRFKGSDPIGHGDDVSSMAQEIVLQAALVYVLESGRESFSGFQVDDEESPFYTGLGQTLLRQSRLSVLQLNQKLNRRLANYSR
jgi:hypothetical protein